MTPPHHDPNLLPPHSLPLSWLPLPTFPCSPVPFRLTYKNNCDQGDKKSQEHFLIRQHTPPESCLRPPWQDGAACAKSDGNGYYRLCSR